MYRLRLGVSLQAFERGQAKINANFEQDLQEAKRQGFDSVDVDLCTIYDRDTILKSHSFIDVALDMVKSKGLYLNGVHLPFGGHRDYSNVDESYRKQLIEDTAEMLRIADSFYPNCYVIHGSAEPIKRAEREEKMLCLQDSLRKVCQCTKNYVCVENLPRTCLLNTVDEHVRVIEANKDLPNLKACCDVNHYLRQKAEDAIEKLGNRIMTLHISDHDYIDERHVLPKDGKIAWMKVLAALEKIGYQGVFNYEIARALYEYVFYTLGDIKRNYEELFQEYNKISI